MFLDLFCGLPDAVMFGTRNVAKKIIIIKHHNYHIDPKGSTLICIYIFLLAWRFPLFLFVGLQSPGGGSTGARLRVSDCDYDDYDDEDDDYDYTYDYHNDYYYYTTTTTTTATATTTTTAIQVGGTSPNGALAICF